jgi:hypothetical protein
VPTSLSLKGGNVTIGAGATVATDAGGNIAVKGQGSGAIKISGRLEALGGSIDVSGESATVVTVARTAEFAARGVARIETDGRGQRHGAVLGGGSVTFDAGTVTLESGSLIDVPGASGEIDVSSGGGWSRPVTLASNGGSISVKGQGLIEGTWRGEAGGSGALGGAISLSTPTGIPLIVSDRAARQAAAMVFRPSVMQSGGFADLTFNAEQVRLEGVNLTLGGSISITGLMNGNGKDSRLSAPHTVLSGTSASGVAGGTLTLVASLIDVAVGRIRGFDQTVLEAVDIRLLGNGPEARTALLDVDGILTLKAAQIYPASQISATIRASNKIVVQQNGIAGPALSVGGTLLLEAPVIEQGGTLKAPFGEIVLRASNKVTLAAGSVTSVTGDGLVMPYGNLSDNEQWVLPTPSGQGNPTPITALPEKRITLEAPSVNLAAGSVVDIRGGGDLYAWEHVAGPGGSQNLARSFRARPCRSLPAASALVAATAWCSIRRRWPCFATRRT